LWQVFLASIRKSRNFTYLFQFFCHFVKQVKYLYVSAAYAAPEALRFCFVRRGFCHVFRNVFCPVFTERCYASAAYAVMRCLSVCLFVRLCVTLVNSVKTNEHIFNSFSLVFPNQTSWQYCDRNFCNGGVECMWVGRKRDSQPIFGFWAKLEKGHEAGYITTDFGKCSGGGIICSPA